MMQNQKTRNYHWMQRQIIDSVNVAILMVDVRPLRDRAWDTKSRSVALWHGKITSTAKQEVYGISGRHSASFFVNVNGVVTALGVDRLFTGPMQHWKDQAIRLTGLRGKCLVLMWHDYTYNEYPPDEFAAEVAFASLGLHRMSLIAEAYGSAVSWNLRRQAVDDIDFNRTVAIG